MGVPKFFRWISERYPKINQPIHAPPNQETQLQYFPNTTPIQGSDQTKEKNSSSTTAAASPKLKQDSKVYMQKNSILPEFDRLYLDMNGIIHCCSHNNASDDNATTDPDTKIEADVGSGGSGGSALDAEKLLTDSLAPAHSSSTQPEGTVQITEDEIFRNVCYYVDRIVTDIVQPKELVYMAIDGVAPRAKMNQQRSRRYRSGKEREIEKTFYQASLLKQKKEREMMDEMQSLERTLERNGEYAFHGDDELFNFVNMDGEYEYNRENVSRSFQKKNATSEKDDFGDTSMSNMSTGDVKEVEPGRFTGKFETSGKGSSSSSSSSTTSTTTTNDSPSYSISSSQSSTSFDGDSSHNNLFDLDYEDFIQSMKEIEKDAPSTDGSRTFHSNEITPGTPFFERCTAHLQHFIKRKLHTDPRWAHLTIIFSGPRTPGEGEHKIMDFIRDQKHKKDYNPNTRHCLFGQDGDLIMLGLATHEPHFALLREEVIFDQSRIKANLQMIKAAKQKLRKEELAAVSGDADGNSPVISESLSASIDSYIHNSNFELLHMSILRDYLAYEFETKDVVPTSPFELEQTIDDFVFMTFFVGNDFLPHMPAIDIADEAFDLLFYTYKRNRWKWLNGGKRSNHKKYPYLTNSGNIVSGQRLEQFLSNLGKHEDPYYDNKQRNLADENQRMRNAAKKAGRNSSVPPEEVLAAREEWERENYKEMLKTITTQQDAAIPTNGFKPVISQSGIFNEMEIKKKSFEFKVEECEEELEEGFVSRMGTLFRNSLSGSGDALGDATGEIKGSESHNSDDFDEHVEDLKGRYYYDKFKFSPLDAEKHIALRKAYIEGLVWNLQYYYKGCVSWEWYYPYHYGPMLSDLKNINKFLKQISFENDLSEPLQPFEQLMANLPPSSAELLPIPYQWLMKSPKSPIIDFYPESFTVDMNGKRWPWEAVVLLPFIDSSQLITASRDFVKTDLLSEDERSRNEEKDALVYVRDESCSTHVQALNSTRQNFEAIKDCNVREDSITATSWGHNENERDIAFRPELLPGTSLPFAGFPSLKDAPVQALRRKKVGINIFGMRSRYRTAVLEMNNDVPMIASASSLAGKFIGTTLHFRYPFLQEGFVTALSDAEMTVRGEDSPRAWTEKEAQSWKLKNEIIRRQYVNGEGLTGSGGWDIPESTVTLSVRPLKEIQTLEDGRKVKVYARLEIEVPFIAALWSPSQPDPRLANLPSKLEKNPYRFVSEPLSPSLARLRNISKRKRGNKRQSDSRSSQRKTPTFSNVTKNSQNGILPPRLPVVGQKHNLGGTKGLCTSAWQVYNDEKRAKAYVRPRKINVGPKAKIPSFKRSMQFVAISTAFLFQGVKSEIINSHSSSPFIHPLHSRLIERSWNEPQIVDTNEEVKENDASTPPLEFAHGTTTLSFTFDNGIVAAVDSRASIGNFVGSKTTQKVLPITDHIIGTMAGGAADCSFWIRKLQAESRHYELTNGRPINVSRVSRVLADYLYQNRGFDLSVGTMIMGFDDEQGASIYYVDNNGNRFRSDLFAVGSGATFALGVLDTERRIDMTEDKAVALAIKAIRHATFRDAFSGGYIAVYVIKESGWKKVFSEDLALLDHD